MGKEQVWNGAMGTYNLTHYLFSNVGLHPHDTGDKSMKFPKLKTYVIWGLFILGEVLMLLSWVNSVLGFIISSIPLLSIYPLQMLWYGKERARGYGIFIIILLAAMALLVFVILPGRR
jgi:hypothetical protein